MSKLDEIVKNKIMGINFDWQVEDETFDRSGKCEGEILVNHDGTFEGMVKEEGTETKEHFIFGILVHGVVAELYDLSTLDIPYRFMGLDNGEGYEGSFYGIVGTDRDGIELGTSKIEVKRLDSMSYDTLLANLSDLYKRMSAWKDQMSTSNSELYTKEISECKERQRELLREFGCQVKPKKLVINPVKKQD